MSNAEKNAALAKIAKGASIAPAGNTKVRIGKSIVHVRYCSPNATALGKFKFNINPNTLSADYELWVCGTAAVYYLMPISLMQGIYDNPDTYVDRRHPEIRVVSVDTHSHTVTYAGCKSEMLVNRCRNKNSPGQINHFMIGGNVQLYHKDYHHGKRLLSRDYRRSQQKVS